jgi:inner membrane transporter RhtA
VRISFVAITCLLAAMISIQAGASLAKQLFPAIGAEGTTSARLAFAALILFIIWRPWRSLPKGKAWRQLMLYGVSLGSMNLLFYMAIDRIPLGVAVALEFCGPLAVALYNSRKVRDLVWVMCALTGIICLLPISAVSEHLDPIGTALALGAGVFWGLYIVFGQSAGQESHGGSTVAWGMGFAAIIACPVGVASTGSALLDVHLVPLMLGVALLSSVIPYSLEMVALQKLPAKTFSILMSIEPAIAALSGWVYLQESLSLVQWFAICMVITASVGSALTAGRQTPQPDMAG